MINTDSWAGASHLSKEQMFSLVQTRLFIKVCILLLNRRGAFNFHLTQDELSPRETFLDKSLHTGLRTTNLNYIFISRMLLWMEMKSNRKTTYFLLVCYFILNAKTHILTMFILSIFKHTDSKHEQILFIYLFIFPAIHYSTHAKFKPFLKGIQFKSIAFWPKDPKWDLRSMEGWHFWNLDATEKKFKM
jgi:hypothetical protein